MSKPLNVEGSVRDRYSQAAKKLEVALCCPTPDYKKEYLEAIPPEVIERDYGCGDPSKYVGVGETVLDLGSGSGKICFIVSQMVGQAGKVIGVDMNDDMLELSRRAAVTVAERIGYSNTAFVRGRIQDLRFDRDRADSFLREHPIKSEADLRRFEDYATEQRIKAPLIEDNSVDVVVSNCVLNLVAAAEKRQLFSEIFRVLKRGGRAVISDIVSDEDVPMHLQQDSDLWSGCISGAFQEAGFLRAFEEAGFYGVSVAKRDEQPWQTVEGIEFRAMTVIAYKGKEGECWDHKEALIYQGPFKSVTDDDGHTFLRGERVAVCRKTHEIFTRAPYAGQFFSVPPLQAVSAEAAEPFPCTGGVLKRHPRETKGEDYSLTMASDPAACCEPGQC